MKQTDYLVIGSGVAGLTFALKIAQRYPERKITIITKSDESESNTKYAQGGVAVVMNKVEDSYEKHIEDTLIAGDGLCDKEVVEMVIEQGQQRFKELVAWGAQFDKDTKAEFDLGKEGGHSENRVVHYKDQTGFEIERAILVQIHNQENIEVFDYHFAIDLILEENRCIGAYVLNQKDQSIAAIVSNFTLLATGGIGQVYGHTTNPKIATGDGIAMAYRARAEIKDMEFIQFHPTALYNSKSENVFLISEAVRGFGAYLRTKDGRRFMLDYDERAELASRDIVSQCIDKELKQSKEPCVYLDCTHLDLEGFIKHFPMIYERCKNNGIDIAKDWIPVVPAQHYLCGGIAVDKDGKTSIENLFACGECSRTGLHGANRLASNSLLEALVYSDRIYHYIADNSIYSINETIKVNSWNTKATLGLTLDFEQMRLDFQNLMRDSAGIIRKNSDLMKAQAQLLIWQTEIEELSNQYQLTTPFYELRNMIAVGLLIVQQSLKRKENRGGFIKTAN